MVSCETEEAALVALEKDVVVMVVLIRIFEFFSTSRSRSWSSSPTLPRFYGERCAMERRGVRNVV